MSARREPSQQFKLYTPANRLERQTAFRILNLVREQQTTIRYTKNLVETFVVLVGRDNEYRSISDCCTAREFGAQETFGKGPVRKVLINAIGTLSLFDGTTKKGERIAPLFSDYRMPFLVPDGTGLSPAVSIRYFERHSGQDWTLACSLNPAFNCSVLCRNCAVGRGGKVSISVYCAAQEIVGPRI